MRKYFVLLLLLIRTVCFSQPVDIQKAQRVSKNYFRKMYQNGVDIKGKNKHVDTDTLDVKSSFTKKFKGHNSYYVTNFKNGGWVITAAHKAIGPVLAHSPTGSIDLNKTIPVFDEWMSQYDSVIDSAFIKKKIVKAKQQKWDSIETDSVIPKSKLKKTYTANGFYLVDTQWGQDESNDQCGLAAYNYWMPDKNCSSHTEYKAPAGCVPVAIGQIMKYWEFATGDYADFDWWDMPNSLKLYQTDPPYYLNPYFYKQRNAVSYLLKRIGDRVAVNYDCNGSSASTQDKGIYCFREFGYVESDMILYKKKNYSLIEWCTILKAEIDANRPVLYRSDSYASGHAFVCDGYTYGTYAFHFNFGWNNSSDGYYYIEDLSSDFCYNGLTGTDCMSFDFTSLSSHMCITGIHPNWQSVQNLSNISIATLSTDQWPNKITYQARELNVAGDINARVWIGPKSDGRFLAYQDVDLKPGFWAMRGSTMLAKTYANVQGTLKSFQEFEIENQSPLTTINDNISDSISDFSIYPNPIRDGKLTISSKSISNDITTIEIYNLLGQKVYSFKESLLFQKHIDMSSYPKGIFLVKIINKERNYIYNIINQ